MRYKKTIAASMFVLLGLTGLYAQDNLNASGGESIGTGGSVSYSVGQIIYSTDTGNNGSVAKGIQQPFEIFTVTGINETAINLSLNVYPNPTTNFLDLQIDGEKLDNLTYQLVDLQGKIIESKNMGNLITRIPMENLPKATYLLRVNNSERIVKTFKIIKN